MDLCVHSTLLRLGSSLAHRSLPKTMRDARLARDHKEEIWCFLCRSEHGQKHIYMCARRCSLCVAKATALPLLEAKLGGHQRRKGSNGSSHTGSWILTPIASVLAGMEWAKTGDSILTHQAPQVCVKKNNRYGETRRSQGPKPRTEALCSKIHMIQPWILIPLICSHLILCHFIIVLCVSCIFQRGMPYLMHT